MTLAVGSRLGPYEVLATLGAGGMGEVCIPEGLLADSKAARRAGFSGRIAIHPDQSEIINTAFTPDENEVAFARRVVDAFAAAGGAGTLQLDGKMLDRPHLTQAQKLLELAARSAR